MLPRFLFRDCDKSGFCITQRSPLGAEQPLAYLFLPCLNRFFHKKTSPNPLDFQKKIRDIARSKQHRDTVSEVHLTSCDIPAFAAVR